MSRQRKVAISTTFVAKGAAAVVKSLSIAPRTRIFVAQRMDVAVVIVNYRTAEATVAAVTALQGDLDKLVDPLVVVVDNASGDGSAERLARVCGEPRWAGRVIVLPSRHNGGFGYGMNLGVRHVLASGRRPRFVYMLNP